MPTQQVTPLCSTTLWRRIDDFWDHNFATSGKQILKPGQTIKHMTCRVRIGEQTKWARI